MKIADFYRRKLKNDLTSKRYGRLKVLHRTDYKNRRVIWLCVCDCGNITRVESSALIRGNIFGCGCKSGNITHGHSGKNETRTYRAWHSMKDRCLNKNHKAYMRYGGRGIEICERWTRFENFLEDMGENKERLTLERVDNEKGYSPDNCKWATMADQANNRSGNRILTHKGETLTLAKWAKRFSVNSAVFTKRINDGWDFEKAVHEPVKVVKLFSFEDKEMTLSEWSKFLKIKKRTLESRIMRGWTVEKMLGTPLISR